MASVGPMCARQRPATLAGCRPFRRRTSPGGGLRSLAVPYGTVLFDLDHTLFDSDASEAAAFDETLRSVGVDEPGDYFAVYDRINRALWKRVEAGEIGAGDVRVARFAQLVAVTDLDADPEELAASFAHGLATHGDLYPGVRTVLDGLWSRRQMGLVTNGISVIQRTRIERLALAQYFECIVVSSEVGVSKPAPEIFDVAFSGLGEPARNAALMVGDSLTSDMAGAIGYGIGTCWYNPNGDLRPVDLPIDHVVKRISEVPSVVVD